MTNKSSKDMEWCNHIVLCNWTIDLMRSSADGREGVATDQRMLFVAFVVLKLMIGA